VYICAAIFTYYAADEDIETLVSILSATGHPHCTSTAGCQLIQVEVMSGCFGHNSSAVVQAGLPGRFSGTREQEHQHYHSSTPDISKMQNNALLNSRQAP
jgi:hypothetical protein